MQHGHRLFGVLASRRQKPRTGCVLARSYKPLRYTSTRQDAGKWTIPLLLGPFLLIAATAQASVTSIELDALVARSDVIVVCVVKTIAELPQTDDQREREFPPLRVATARVLESWKGNVNDEVRFWCSPRQTCDSACAQEGEKLVLFLEREAGASILTISHLGRGRMAVQKGKAKGQESVEIDTKVDLPPNAGVTKSSRLETLQIPRALLKPGEQGFKSISIKVPIQSMETSRLRALVKNLVKADPPASNTVPSTTNGPTKRK
jgi:hypothetical protein